MDAHIKAFYTPLSYRGFTEDLLKTAAAGIKGNDYSKILYLAPTPLKIRDSQQVFHKFIKGSYIPPEMMTIKQFSKRLYPIYGDKTLIPGPLIPVIISRLSGKGMGFASLISNFMDELKQYRPDKGVDAVGEEMKGIFKELNVPEEGAQRAIGSLEIFREYTDLLNKHNAIDENDVLAKCPSLIRKHSHVFDTLIIDGFYEVTPAEELLLKCLVEQSKIVLISIPSDDNFLSITNGLSNFINNNFMVEKVFLPAGRRPKTAPYISYAGMDEEIEGIARHIKNLFISGKQRSLNNIMLTFPKLHIYADIVERVFRRYGIPHTFSVSKPLGKTKPFLDLMALLESVVDDYPRLQFSRFLISPYFKNIPEIFRKWIPRISVSSGVIKGKNEWLSLMKQPAIGDFPLPEAQDFEKGLKWIFKKLAPLESIKDSGTHRQFCEILYKLLADLDFSDEDIGLNTSSSHKEQLAAAFKDLSFIDTLEIPCAVPTIRDLRLFIDSLKHILNTAEIEAEGTGVQVMSFFDLRGTEPEYLYFGGLKDGDLPSMPEMDHILPDNVRTRLGFVNMKKYLHLQKFLFQRLTDSSKNLHLSYPAMEADKLFLPSPFLPWKAETREDIPGILCKQEELLKEGDKILSSLIKEINGINAASIKKRFGKNSYIRVTDIDNYRTCPRKFFIEKILNLKPSEIKEYAVEAMLLGAIIHKIMEELMSKPFTDLDAMRLNAEKILEKLLDEQPIETYWRNFIRDSFLSILPDIYEIEGKLRDEGYYFMKAEVPVEEEILKEIKLKGKIDRVDRKVRSEKLGVKGSEKNNNEVEIIDYKTGSARLSRTEILNKGASLQLFLYAALMKSLGFKVNRVGIYSLKDLTIAWIPGKKDIREGMTIDDYIKAGLRYLEETVSKIRIKDFSALPLNEQTCRTCHEKPYCPYIQT